MSASGASGGETFSFEFFVVFNGVCVDVDRHEMYRKNGARTEKRKTLVFVFRRVHQHSLPSLYRLISVFGIFGKFSNVCFTIFSFSTTSYSLHALMLYASGMAY